MNGPLLNRTLATIIYLVFFQRGIVERALLFLKDRTEHYLAPVRQYMSDICHKFQILVSGEANRDVQSFLDTDHTFEEYTEEIAKYQSIQREVTSIHTIVHFPIMRLDCDDLKRGLIAKANSFSDTLLKRLSSDHFAENERIIGEFEKMKDVLLSQPNDTAEVMELMSFVEDASTVQLVQLNDCIINNQVCCLGIALAAVQK